MAYHSRHVCRPDGGPWHTRCGFPIISFRTEFKGLIKTDTQDRQASLPTPGTVPDIVEEALSCFLLNVQFRSYHLASPADRVLCYCLLWIQWCLHECATKGFGNFDLCKQMLESKAASRMPGPGLFMW